MNKYREPRGFIILDRARELTVKFSKSRSYFEV